MGGFFKKAIDLIVHPSHSRTMMILLAFTMIAGLSLTVIASQQQQQLKQRASGICAEVTNLCEGVTVGETCATPGEISRCRLGNDIVECK